jgi:hypothetical protein
MTVRNFTGFGVVERAAAETAALRRLQNDLDNTSERCRLGFYLSIDIQDLIRQAVEHKDFPR